MAGGLLPGSVRFRGQPLLACRDATDIVANRIHTKLVSGECNSGTL